MIIFHQNEIDILSSCKSLYYNNSSDNTMEHVIPKLRVEEAICGQVISCEEYHGGSCATDIVPKRFIRTAELMGGTYLAIHLFPFLIFKMKKFMKK